MAKDKIRLNINLTERQAQELLDVCKLGKHIHREFAMHDDWQYGSDKKDRQKTLSNHQAFTKAIKMLRAKMGQ